MSDIDTRIREAVECGLAAFWEQVAAAFPEACAGDLSPDADHALRSSASLAARIWVVTNVVECARRPAPDKEPS